MSIVCSGWGLAQGVGFSAACAVTCGRHASRSADTRICDMICTRPPSLKGPRWQVRAGFSLFILRLSGRLGFSDHDGCGNVGIRSAVVASLSNIVVYDRMFDGSIGGVCKCSHSTSNNICDLFWVFGLVSLFGTWRLSLPPSLFRRYFFFGQQTLSLPPCLFVVLASCLCIIHCGVAITV